MDSKPWYASVTIWGALLAAVAPVAGLILHHSISDGDVQSAAMAFAAIGGGVGSLIAILGRWRATTSLTFRAASGAPPAVKALLPLALLTGMGVILSACAEAQNAVAAFDAMAVQADDRVRGDEAVAIEQLKCRLPYATLMTLSAKYPNYSATVALSCGTLPATPFGTVVSPALPVIQMTAPAPAKPAS